MTTRWYFQQIFMYVIFVILLLVFLVIGNYFIFVTLPKHDSYVIKTIILPFLIVASFVLVWCLLILVDFIKRYVKLIVSNRRIFYHNHLEWASNVLMKKIADCSNTGKDQAKELLRAVYVVSRSSIFGVWQFKLNYCLKVIREICPNVNAIEARTEYHPNGLVEYLHISYSILGKPIETQIRIAEALD